MVMIVMITLPDNYHPKPVIGASTESLR